MLAKVTFCLLTKKMTFCHKRLHILSEKMTLHMLEAVKTTL